MTRAARRLAAIEARRPPPARPKTWLDHLEVAELRVLERLAAANGGELPRDDPLARALIAAGRARLAGHAVAPLADLPDRPRYPADVAALCAGRVWWYPPEPEDMSSIPGLG